jgi:hypothetical protein
MYLVFRVNQYPTPDDLKPPAPDPIDMEVAELTMAEAQRGPVAGLDY